MKSSHSDTHLWNLLGNTSIVSLRRALLYLLIASLILQAGKHFWWDFSFVMGVRVDYLSPTLYFSDLIVIALFLLEGMDMVMRKKIRPFIFLVGMIAAFYVYVPFVAVPEAHLWGVVLLCKYLFVGYVVANYFEARDILPFLYILVFGVLIESLLVFGQMVFQSSVQGPFYFLGERAIDSSSFGAATFYMFGYEALRAYGTFPHPNVLAFYLYMSLVFLISCYAVYKARVFLISIFLGSVALLFTFSRFTILLYVATLVYFFWRRGRRYLAAFFGAAFGLYVFIFSTRFGVESVMRDLTYRKELFEISLNGLSGSYLFGEGMFNYFFLQAPFYKTISPIFLQPVHNIYVLVFLQLGVVGLVLVGVLMWKTLRRGYWAFCARGEFDEALFVVFCSALALGLLDHFFVTLQQGALMAAVIVGLIWRRRVDFK